nr:transposase (putative), gypsy type [Tanacetum cinerariifolium]
MVLIPYSNIWSYPKVLSPYNGHGQLANRRYPGVRLGDVAVVGTAGTIPRLYQYNPNGSPYNQSVTITRTRLSRDSEDSQMMGHMGPTGWMSFSKRLGKNTPQCYTKPLDSLKNWNNRFFWMDERVFPTVVDWRTNAPKDGMLAENTYSVEAVRALDTHRTPIQKQPEMLLCLVGISRRYYLGDEVYPTFLYDDDRDMDLFNLIRAPNPTKVKTESHPRTADEVPLLTLTANRVVEMEDPAVATDSSGVTSTIERSPLDFANEARASDQGAAAPEVPPLEDVQAASVPEVGQAEEVAATDPSAATESRKRGRDGADVNAPTKVLRRDHADPRPTGSTRGGESLAAIELGLASTRPVPAPENAPAGMSDPDSLSFADPQSRHPANIAQSSQGTAAAGDPESGNASFASAVESPDSIYRPEWGVPNGSMLDTPEACQDLVDHVAMGSQLRLRFEQEAKLLRKSVAQVARQDKRIQALELKIKNLEALLEAEADMKKAAEDKSARLSQELEDMRARFSDLQVSNERLSQQVATLQEQVSGEEKLKAAFEEFKQYEDSRVEQRCAEMDARLDALSIDFDEELYPHMLTAIAGRRGIAKGMSEGLRHRVEHRQAQLSLDSIEAYDPEAKSKYVTALQALKDLKFPLVDQLEGLKDRSVLFPPCKYEYECKYVNT